MTGLYIHIPFCLRRCAYCDFYSQTDETLMGQYVEAITKEIALRADETNRRLATIYIGGGTPSQLPLPLIERLFSAIRADFDIATDAEITFECNPDDLTHDYIANLRTTPVNRLSIGIQSFDNSDLCTLLRRHTGEQAHEAVENCFAAGFRNISIDLIYGLPDQTIEGWQRNLRRAFALPIHHLSAYHLTYEEGTVLHRRLTRGEIVETDEELSIELFHLLREESRQAGMIHYEISNFGREGCFSQHNSSYWNGAFYLGVGASAHSYDGVRRSITTPNISQYIGRLDQNSLPIARETLSEIDRYNDYVMTRLRTMWGISTEEIAQQFGASVAHELQLSARSFVRSGDLIDQNAHLILTPQGMLRSDGIIAELFRV